MKFNVGNDHSSVDDYTRRLAAWIGDLGPIAAVCECHHGISVAEDPDVAALILAGAGPPEQVQALVHTHDPPDLIARKMDVLGDRVTHVHVNHLDLKTMSHPSLAAVEDELRGTVDHLRGRGFTGSWTLEFVSGLLTDADHPGALLDQAAADLIVLRNLIERS